MNGIEMSELRELVSQYHDVEFEYKGVTYVLQPEARGGRTYLVIWDCTPNASKCIAEQEVDSEGDIPQEAIQAVLSEKRFDGKSFLEIEQEITVTVIF